MPNVATLGLPYTMVRFLSAEKEKSRIQEGFFSIFIVILFSTLTVSILFLLFSKDIASSLFNGNIQVSLVLPVIIFLVCLNTLLLNFFRTFQEMKRYSIILLVQTYLGIIIVSYFAITGFGVYFATLGLLLANSISFIIMVSIIFSEIGLVIPKFKNLKEYLSFGLPTIPSNFSYWIVDTSDRYVIGILLGAASVGYYAPGYTLANILLQFIGPFSTLLPAVLSKYYEEKNMEKVLIFLKYSLKYFLLLAIPAAFGLSLLSRPILMILTTPEIASNGYLITPFVAVSTVLFGIYAIVVNIIILEKKTKITGIIWMFAAVLNLVLNIILVPYVGIVGAAAVTLIAYSVALVLTLSYTFKFHRLDFDPRFIFKSVAASSVMSYIIIYLNPSGILSIIITIAISSLVYFALILLFKSIKKEELELFWNIIKK